MGIRFEELPAKIKTRIIADNPDVFGHGLGSVQTSESKPTPAPALDGRGEKLKGRKNSVAYRISFVIFSRRSMDSDNLQGSVKGLRDAVAESIGIDDGDPKITWEYAWAKTEGQQGVLVKIEA